MRKLLDSAWFNFIRLFQWHRVLGIGTLSVLAWVLVVRFNHVDVGWLLPREEPVGPAPFQWPDLPGFSVTTSATTSEKRSEKIFTVPTRQFTSRELSQLPPDRSPSEPTSSPSPNPAR